MLKELFKAAIFNHIASDTFLNFFFLFPNYSIFTWNDEPIPNVQSNDDWILSLVLSEKFNWSELWCIIVHVNRKFAFVPWIFFSFYYVFYPNIIFHSFFQLNNEKIENNCLVAHQNIKIDISKLYKEFQINWMELGSKLIMIDYKCYYVDWRSF